MTAVLTQAPHPYAAMLFVDFLHSTEGQQLYRDAFYVPANPKVQSQMPELHPAVGKYKANIVSPEDLGANIDKWTDLYKKMFVK